MIRQSKSVWILLSLLSFSWLLTVSPAFCQDKINLPCEVMESSDALKSSSGNLNGVRYILLHHANSADRETLSKWLKAYSGTEVKFMFEGKEYKGILCRLAHCFGRGLLIYTADVKPVKRDIIDVILPRTP
ncbi:MAG: hypothetical protein H8D96_05195 [Desulfobacterales bacterium]|uniref:Uncharacterized protein n=1 Tax=Candidatus Desulfatibia vada TaxID=2841696 RepID=A0A8J6NPV0_9BACT|nr:hypothetical protein [Candidatus Desulfatibia vada]MBL7217835.1 hypothetical protein [Desulfobacteraceae bacterium]